MRWYIFRLIFLIVQIPSFSHKKEGVKKEILTGKDPKESIIHNP